MRNKKEILKKWCFIIKFFFPIVIFLAGLVFIYHFLNATPPGPEIYKMDWFKGGEVNNFDKYGSAPAPIKRCDFFKQAIRWSSQYNSVLTFENFDWQIKLRLWRPHPIFAGYWQYADTLIYVLHGFDQFRFKVGKVEYQPEKRILKINFKKVSRLAFYFLIIVWIIIFLYHFFIYL